MRRAKRMAWLAITLLGLASAAGCQVTFQEGQFTCSANADCPPGYGACVAGRCMIPDAWVERPDAWQADAWSETDAADADAADADASDIDADVDAGTTDIDADTSDADTSDADISDADTSDAGADPADTGTAP